MKAVSPEGNEIIGTLEMIEGVARADVSLRKNGRLQVEFLGDTDVDWNSQIIKAQKGERLFVCSRRKVWRESQVKTATRTRGKKR
jgi:hypothetical protein